MLAIKTLSLSDCELKFAGAEGRFTGYGSVFSVVDAHNDIIMPGAYADVLKAGDPVDVHVNHDWMSGALPVGRWSGLAEDAKGLAGTADLVMQMSTAANAYWAMKSGIVNGLSVAIIPDHKATERRPDGVRVIHRVKALKEISIVTSPANAQARVMDIKALDDLHDAIEAVQTIRDFEGLLRDAGGLTKGAAAALTARAKFLFGQGDPSKEVEAKDCDELQFVLRRIKARIPL